jgi:Carboxypeptidase regulatory-like domain/TonB-dependent Receptor Plug Domain
MNTRLMRYVLLLAIVTLPLALFAQVTGQITGTVRDNTGAVVSGAKVTIHDTAKGVDRTTNSNSDGEYLVSGLPVGTYDVSVAAPGFKTYNAKALKLDIGQKARVDVEMAVGAVNTEVVVQGADVAQVETQSSDLSGVVSGKQITQLELNGRNFTQLVTLVPGVSNQTGQDEGQVGIAGNVNFSINGGRTEYNNWELDGGDNMDNGSNNTLNVYPSLEAISEFRVLTSNYGAQYGRNGSGTVEVETKSGTNQFHGNVFEFLRNDAFNARPYFQSSVPPYKKNDFGYTIGGPVFIPNVYNTDKKKTFFFWSQDWRRNRVPRDFNALVPSAAERAGDFSAICASDPGHCPSIVDPNDPNNRISVPNITVLPAFQQSQAVSQALLTLIPLPTNVTPEGSKFIAAVSEPENWREELIRVDHNFTDNMRLTFRYIHDSWEQNQAIPLWTNAGSFPTLGTDFKGPGVSLVTRLSNTFSPTLLNEFVFSYTTDHIILNNNRNWQRPSGLPIGDLFGGNGGGIMPGFNLVTDLYGGGFGQDAGYIPNGVYNSNPTYTYRDNITKIFGKHNLQFGAYAAFGQKNELGGELGAGSIPGYLTFDDSAGVTSGNAFADLLLGYVSSFGQQDQRIKYYNRYKILEPYFQDDWRITSRLTLNLGLRVSLYGTYREKQKQAFNFDPARYVFGQTSVDPNTGNVIGLTANGLPPSVSNLPNGMVQCGVTPGVPVSCMQGHLFNPAPRIGFAWDPKGDGRTAIRGGYGVFFEHANGNEGNTESLENSPPLATTVQQNNIGGNGFVGQPSGYTLIGTTAGTAQGQLPLSVNAIPTKAQWPYIQQWHLDVQQEVIKNTVATVSYVGSKGTHLNRQTNLNQLFPVPLSSNPYLPGEPIDADPTSATFNTDCNTLSVNGAPVSGAVADNVAVAACGASPDPFRPFPGYGDITHLEWKSSSIYHALQTSVRRNIGGLQMQFAYTYSHSIDDSSDRFDGSFVNSYDPAANRASSNFDQRHILNLSWVWDVPIFRNPGFANKVLGGWQYSGIFSYSTGAPYSVVFSGDNAGVANGVGSGSRPDVVGDPFSGIPQAPLDGFGPLFGNPNAFAAPRGLTFGDAARNMLRNPNRTNFDMALFKHFKFTERLSFEFRGEAFNVFNHTQWSCVAGDSGSAAANIGCGNNTFSTDPTSGFLRVSDTHNPRILQLGAKFIF